uniref:CC domain-containing protein n=1 Tax=Syphacia muris TaxID=451379 RepID=A0A0N5AGN0_9BILA
MNLRSSSIKLSITACVDNECPEGYTCINDQCYKTKAANNYGCCGYYGNYMAALRARRHVLEYPQTDDSNMQQ